MQITTSGEQVMIHTYEITVAYDGYRDHAEELDSREAAVDEYLARLEDALRGGIPTGWEMTLRELDHYSDDGETISTKNVDSRVMARMKTGASALL